MPPKKRPKAPPRRRLSKADVRDIGLLSKKKIQALGLSESQSARVLRSQQARKASKARWALPPPPPPTKKRAAKPPVKPPVRKVKRPVKAAPAKTPRKTETRPRVKKVLAAKAPQAKKRAPRLTHEDLKEYSHLTDNALKKLHLTKAEMQQIRDMQRPRFPLNVQKPALPGKVRRKLAKVRTHYTLDQFEDIRDRVVTFIDAAFAKVVDLVEPLSVAYFGAKKLENLNVEAQAIFGNFPERWAMSKIMDRITAALDKVFGREPNIWIDFQRPAPEQTEKQKRRSPLPSFRGMPAAFTYARPGNAVPQLGAAIVAIDKQMRKKGYPKADSISVIVVWNMSRKRPQRPS